MSTTATAPQPAKEHTGTVSDKPVTWKQPVLLAVLGLVAFVFFGILGPDKTAKFGISSGGDFFQLPVIEVPAALGGTVLSIILLGLAGYAAFLKTRGQRPPRWLPILFTVLFVIAFLVWVVGGARTPSISLAGLIAGSVTLAVPLVFGSLSGVLCERVGVVNIAIEGQLLGGAFTAAIVASVTQNPFIGLLAAAAAGALVSMVLAVFSIKYVVNQIIVGVVLNVLVSGLTGFLFSTVMQENKELFNSPGRLPIIDIPVLSSIPLLGPILFKQSVVGYLMYVAVIVVWIGLFKTKWGLRVRAVGEHPQAADTMGIKVNATRFWNVTLGGAIAGIGGSFFTLVAIDSFTKEISGGRGFIALAALIFGRWNPIGAFFAALLFGFADNLQSIVTIIGTPGAEPVHGHAAVPRHRAGGGRPRRTLPATGGERHPVREGLTPMTANDVDWSALEAAANAAMGNAYAPYSKFPVGAAALTADGRIISGCNVENASYGLTLCAECALVGQLHMTGGGLLRAFYCVDAAGNVLMPCGRCRQLLYEFRAPDMELMTTQGIRTMDQVLPDAFGPQDLEENQ